MLPATVAHRQHYASAISADIYRQPHLSLSTSPPPHRSGPEIVYKTPSSHSSSFPSPPSNNLFNILSHASLPKRFLSTPTVTLGPSIRNPVPHSSSLPSPPTNNFFGNPFDLLPLHSTLGHIPTASLLVRHAYYILRSHLHQSFSTIISTLQSSHLLRHPLLLLEEVYTIYLPSPLTHPCGNRSCLSTAVRDPSQLRPALWEG